MSAKEEIIIIINVQEVNIELWDGAELGKFRYDDDFFFKNLCAIQMKLTLCVFKNPIGAISWEKLKCLCISAGILDEEVIADILSGSPCLETLQLDYCHGFSSINVTSKSVKNLVFSTYDSTTFFDQDDIIKINAPYILSLIIKYTMDLREILLLNVSSLAKADLDYWHSISLFALDEKQKKEFFKNDFIQSLGHVKIIH
ncbi:ribonuclease H-like domain-containing protein [Tanacetum coccineum]